MVVFRIFAFQCYNQVVDEVKGYEFFLYSTMSSYALLVAALLQLLLLVIMSAEVTILEAPVEAMVEQLEIDVQGDTLEVEANSLDFKDPEPKTGVEITRLGLSDEEMNIADHLLKKLMDDEETLDRIAKMKENQSVTMESMFGVMSEEVKISNLRKMLFEYSAVEKLFKDPESAFEKMKAAGLIPPARFVEYQENPQLLYDDTHKGLYFSFVTVAVSLGLV